MPSRWRWPVGLLLAVLCAVAAAQGRLALTPEESAWVDSHRSSMRVGIVDFAPLAIRDPATNAWSGLAVDVLRLHERRLGVRFELVPFPSWHELLEAARARRVDLLAFGVRTPERERFLHFSRTFVVLGNLVIVRQGERDLGRIGLAQLSGKRVAVLESSVVHERLRNEHPQVAVLPVREELSALAAVALRQADAAIVETSRATWTIRKEGLTNLAVGGTTNFDYPESLSVRNDWPVMAGLLDKAASSIGDEMFEQIGQQWIHLEGQGFWDDPRQRWTLLGVGAGTLLLILLVLAWNRMLSRQVAARTAELGAQLRLLGETRDELRTSEDKFRSLAELTSDWFWESDELGRFTRVFGGGLDKLALDPHELIGRARWDLNIVGLTAVEIDAHRRVIELRQPFRNFIYQIENRHGQLRWVTVSGTPVFAEDGRYLGYRGSGQDITDRMHDQIARGETLDRLRALLDGTFSFVGLLDARGTLIDCNRTSLRFAGVLKEDVIGRPIWETPWFAIAEDAAQLRQAVAAAAAGDFVRYDARHADQRGAIHWIDFSLSPIFDESGKVVYLVPEGRDITDAKRASEALGNLVSNTSAVFGEAYFRRLVEMLARILVVRYVFVGRLLPGGQRVGTVTFWAADGIVDNIEYALAPMPCARVVDGGPGVYPREVTRLFPEAALLQRMHIESYMGVKVTASSGAPVGLLVALHDQPLVDSASARQLMELFAVRIGTEFERLDHEAQIRELNAGLEQRVEERTAQLLELNNELEAFSYSVSHDLRAPLRHIAGFVEMLAEHSAAALDDEGRRYLRIIAGSAERMGVLIDDLLAFSRIGRVDLHKSSIDCGKLVAEVVVDLETEARGRRVEWRIGPLPELLADRSLLRQVWFNLLANALKYTRERDPAVIEVGAELQGDVWRLHVRDNGVGFNMAYADKLFGVFQRLHGSAQFEGSGIGLANVKRIVERHGGSVGACAREGEGASFFFTLGPSASASAAAATTEVETCRA